MSSPDVTVIVCAYNRREGVLRACLALARQDFPADRYEVIIVDNGSTDGTGEAVRQFAVNDPLVFRHLFESRQGKTHALNTGVSAARGRILAFTDDDCAPAAGWLRALVAALEDPQVGVAGGPVPSHFPDDVMADPGKRALARKFLGDFTLGSEKRELRGRESPLGCNMAVRAEALHRVGGFSPALGPAGQRWGCYEDSDLAWRVRDSGYRLIYEPAAVVDHYPDPARLSREAIRSRAIAVGRCSYLARQRRRAGLGRKCAQTLSSAAELSAQALRWAVCSPSSRKRFIAEFHLLTVIGRMAAIWSPGPAREPGR